MWNKKIKIMPPANLSEAFRFAVKRAGEAGQDATRVATGQAEGSFVIFKELFESDIRPTFTPFANPKRNFSTGRQYGNIAETPLKIVFVNTTETLPKDNPYFARRQEGWNVFADMQRVFIREFKTELKIGDVFHG